MSDTLGFLRAIHAAPDDDLPRIVLADYWEENGKPERGTFIRVQCELARLRALGCHEGEACNVTGPCSECHRDVEAEPLRRRERDLLHAHGRAWAGHDYHYVNAVAGHRGGPLSTYVEFARGFPAAVTGPLAALWRACERCGGRGWWQDMGPNTFTQTCPVCSGRGHAGALAALGPEVLCVGRVEVTDWEPASPNSPYVVGIGDGTHNPSLGSVPMPLFDRLEGYTRLDPESEVIWPAKHYTSPDIARATLSAALLSLACEPWLGK